MYPRIHTGNEAHTQEAENSKLRGKWLLGPVMQREETFQTFLIIRCIQFRSSCSVCAYMCTRKPSALYRYIGSSRLVRLNHFDSCHPPNHTFLYILLPSSAVYLFFFFFFSSSSPVIFFVSSHYTIHDNREFRCFFISQIDSE